MIKEKKVSLKAEELCAELPTPFKIMFQIVQDLEFEDKPNYDKLRKGLRAVIGPCYSKPIFDWNLTGKDKGGTMNCL